MKKNLKYKCEKCGKEIVGKKAYYIWQHKNKNSKRKCFCSSECFAKNKTKPREKLHCKTCGKNIERLKSEIVGNVFCSSHCSAVYSNKKRNENLIKNKCLLCGKEVKGDKSQKFCSAKCSNKKRRNDTIKLWKSGDIFGHSSDLQVKPAIRRYMLEKCDYKCQQCGWGEKNKFSNTIPLVVDHIDGNPENTIEENLRILCPNCDSLTSTYKALNKGNGRESRRKKYKELK